MLGEDSQVPADGMYCTFSTDYRVQTTLRTNGSTSAILLADADHRGVARGGGSPVDKVRTQFNLVQ